MKSYCKYLLSVLIIFVFSGCMPKVNSAMQGYVNYTNCITPVMLTPKSNLSFNHHNLYTITSDVFYKYGIEYVAPPNCEYVYYTDYSVFKNEKRKAVFSNHLINYAWQEQNFPGSSGQIVYKLSIAKYNPSYDNYNVVWEGIMQSSTAANLDNIYDDVYKISNEDRFMVEKMVYAFLKDTNLIQEKSNFTLNPKKVIYNSKEGIKNSIATSFKMINRNKFGVIPAMPSRD